MVRERLRTRRDSLCYIFFSSRRRHTRSLCDWSSDVCSSDLAFASAYQSTPWEAIFCSPMGRTIATAKPLCDAIGMQPELRDGLKEINYGKWEGNTPEFVSQEYHDDYIRWTADPAWYPPTGGELAVAIAHR